MNERKKEMIEVCFRSAGVKFTDSGVISSIDDFWEGVARALRHHDGEDLASIFGQKEG